MVQISPLWVGSLVVSSWVLNVFFVHLYLFVGGWLLFLEGLATVVGRRHVLGGFPWFSDFGGRVP